jgi:uncharacterized membrane protein YfcA
MSGWEMLAVAAAGFAAGGINAVVGSGTLVTFPVLLAVGAIAGGSVGARYGRRPPPAVLRAALVVLGVVAIVVLVRR